MELAKAEGIEMTKDEAEAYLAEMGDVELTDEELQQAAGGVCWNLRCQDKATNAWNAFS